MAIGVSKYLPPEEVEDDLNRLEHGIRQLRIQYEQFFGGGLSREPVLLRGRVTKLIKRYAETPLQKYHHRFRYNSLVGRYNIFCELWGKRLRSFEQHGRHLGVNGKPRERLVATCRYQDEQRDHRALRKLHAEFLQARRHSGVRTEISFDKFAKGVASQADRLRSKSGCAQVELRVVLGADNKVQLKAKPGK